MNQVWKAIERATVRAHYIDLDVSLLFEALEACLDVTFLHDQETREHIANSCANLRISDSIKLYITCDRIT